MKKWEFLVRRKCNADLYMSGLKDGDMGYELTENFLNLDVRAFACNGSALRGKLKFRNGKFVLIENEKASAILNLDHTISLVTNR